MPLGDARKIENLLKCQREELGCSRVPENVYGCRASAKLVAGAGFEPTYSFGEGALILGEIEVAPNATTCQYVQNEAFLSVIVSKTSGALPRPFPTSSADTR